MGVSFTVVVGFFVVFCVVGVVSMTSGDVGCFCGVFCWQPPKKLSTQQIPIIFARCFRCFIVIVMKNI